jgi:hypothetical protein
MAMKVWFVAPSPQKKKPRARSRGSRVRCHAKAAAVTSAVNSAFSVYTRCTFASAQKLGEKARSSAEVAAALRPRPRRRASQCRMPQVAAPVAALKRLIRNATEPRGTSSVHSFPRRT